MEDDKFTEIKDRNLSYIDDFMLNKINTIFSMGLNKEMLDKNEQMYDDYFDILLGEYKKNKESQGFFKKAFQNLIGLCEIKRQYQDQLVNYADTLSSVLNQAGELIQKISFIL